MRMTKEEYLYHKNQDNQIWQCHQQKCAVREFKKAVRDALKPLYDFISRLLGD